MTLAKKVEKKIFNIYKKTIQTISPSSSGNRHHIFVVGVQRSGTNMVMDLFDRSTECTVFHDHNPIAYKNYLIRNINTQKHLSHAAKSKFVVFKPMAELHKLDIFLEEMPPAQGIWLYRNVEDVVNSHLKIWTGMPDFLKTFVKDRKDDNWRGGGISDENYALLQKYVTDDLNNASAVALFWYYRNAQFFEHNHHLNPNIHIVNYDQCVTAPQKHFKRIIKNLGLKARPYMTSHIHNRSIRKNTRPDINEEILALCNGLNRKFQDHCRSIENSHKPVA